MIGVTTVVDKFRHHHLPQLDHRIDSKTRMILQSIISIIMILTLLLLLEYDITTFHVAAFSSFDVLSSSRCRFVKVVPFYQNQQQPQQHPTNTFQLWNERYTSNLFARNRYSQASSSSSSSSSFSIRRISTVPNTLLFSSSRPLLNVALDQPLYTPIRRYFGENFLSLRISHLLNSIVGVLPAFLQTFHNKSLTVRLIKYALICFIVFVCSKFILNKADLSTTSTTSTSSPITPTVSSVTPKEVVPMPFDPNVNEGWSICKLQSIVPFGVGSTSKTTKVSSPYLRITMTLPQTNYILPLQLGQPIHICGLDRNGNAVQAEFYPFPDQQLSSSHSKPTSGYFSLLVPNPAIDSTKTIDTVTLHSEENSNNDLQQRKVVQLLQDYMNTGDTEIAIHPGVTSKLQYRGSHYPVTEIIYLAIGSTGIVPVLDQVRTVLQSSAKSQNSENGSGVERVSVVWITSSIEEFDSLSNVLKQVYEKYPAQLAVSCGVEMSLQSSMTQEIAAEYFFDNNVEINDSVPTFQPGMMAIISVEGIPHTSTALVRQMAKTYLQRLKGFPLDCMCVL